MKFIIYKDKKGEWRWRLRARNGRIIADSGEGYKRKKSAEAMIHRILTLDPLTNTIKELKKPVK